MNFYHAKKNAITHQSLNKCYGNELFGSQVSELDMDMPIEDKDLGEDRDNEDNEDEVVGEKEDDDDKDNEIEENVEEEAEEDKENKVVS